MHQLSNLFFFLIFILSTSDRISCTKIGVKLAAQQDLVTLNCEAWKKTVTIQLPKPVKDVLPTTRKTDKLYKFYTDYVIDFYVCSIIPDNNDREICRQKIKFLWQYDYSRTLDSFNYCGPKCEAFKNEWAKKCASVSESAGGYNQVFVQKSYVDIHGGDICLLDARLQETLNANVVYDNWRRIELPGENMKHLEKYQWKCYFDIGINTPVRINPLTGDVECFGQDGKSCTWGQADNNACYNTVFLKDAFKTAKPLSCGEEHKKLYGGNGYDSPDHWCAKLKAHLLV